jgi:hypothetical protein
MLLAGGRVPFELLGEAVERAAQAALGAAQQLRARTHRRAEGHLGPAVAEVAEGDGGQRVLTLAEDEPLRLDDLAGGRRQLLGLG